MRRLTLLIALIAIGGLAQERTPQMKVLDAMAGGWESVPHVGKPVLIRREWLNDNFLLESAINANNEEEFLAVWTYDPDADRYRRVKLQRAPYFAISMVGTWNAERKSMRWVRLSDKGEQIAFDMDVSGDFVRFGRAKQKRALLPQEDILRRRSPEIAVLQNFVGTWDSELGETKNRIQTTWSRKRKGDFLVSTEGEDKASLRCFDPAAKLYRGVSLERGAASLSTGRWQPHTATLETRIHAFQLPVDEVGKLLKDARFEDGLSITTRERVIHRYLHHLNTSAHVGGVDVWSGKGPMDRHIDVKRFWKPTLSSHPGKALVPRHRFEFDHGNGATIALGAAAKALPLFYDNNSIRKHDRAGHWLHVTFNKFQAGQKVIFWRTKGGNNDGHKWQVNADKTISPMRTEKLALGWKDGELRLLPKASNNLLIFEDPK